MPSFFRSTSLSPHMVWPDGPCLGIWKANCRGRGDGGARGGGGGGEGLHCLPGNDYAAIIHKPFVFMHTVFDLFDLNAFFLLF